MEPDDDNYFWSSDDNDHNDRNMNAISDLMKAYSSLMASYKSLASDYSDLKCELDEARTRCHRHAEEKAELKYEIKALESAKKKTTKKK